MAVSSYKPILYSLLSYVLLNGSCNRYQCQVLALSSSTQRSTKVASNEMSSFEYSTQFNSLSSIRIRSTIRDDLATVSDLLAVETSSSQKSEQQQQKPNPLFGNWNISMKKLKSEASLTSQLTHRLAAMQHATKVLSRQRQLDERQDNRNRYSKDEIRFMLWADDTFRDKLSKAVKTTSTCEETIWDDWNFSLTPDKDMLHHFMLTAVDEDFLGLPVGFCEVGICEIPIDGDTDNDNGTDMIGQKYVPCIGNLVVSPNSRRRGVGKKLIKSVIRLLSTHYHQQYHAPCENGEEEVERFNGLVGLYVEENNSSAIRLYEREGFAATGKKDGKIFMIMNCDDLGTNLDHTSAINEVSSMNEVQENVITSFA